MIVEEMQQEDRETRLAVIERRYRSLIDAVPAQAVWVANPAGEKIDDSVKFRAITGQSPEEYCGFGWMDAIHPMDRAKTERKWRAAFQAQRVYENQYRLRTAAGKYRWFAAHGVPVIENGVVLEWVGTVTDVHAQKVLEEGSRVLRRANELFASTLDERIVLERLPQMIVPALADWCIVDLLNDDDTFQRVGVAHADESQTAVADQLRRGVINLTRSPEDVFSDGRGIIVQELSAEMLRSYATIPDGPQSFSIESMMIVPMSVRGKPLGVIQIISGASRRHYGEEEIELVREVARRAATAIDNARLYAQAANANHARDIFLATLSHEMKTPLTAILGWTRMLRAEGRQSGFFDEALAAVEQSARVQERLIEDILDVSRVITGKLHIEKKPTNLRNVVQAAVEVIIPAAEQSGVHLRIYDDLDLTVEGDETRLRQVVWNLLTNAVKFTPAGGFIEVRTTREGNEAHVIIRDSGRGVAADALPHLFEQFHQVTVADRAKHHGLGLGLAIVRHLVTAHGGRVEARSAGIGKGSEFIVTLPLLDPPFTLDDGQSI